MNLEWQATVFQRYIEVPWYNFEWIPHLSMTPGILRREECIVGQHLLTCSSLAQREHWNRSVAVQVSVQPVKRAAILLDDLRHTYHSRN